MAHNKLQAMTHHPASEEDGEENLEARWTVLKRFTQKIVITMMSRQRDYYCRVGEEGGTSYVREADEATGSCRGLTQALLCTLWAMVFVIHSDAIIQPPLFALSAFDYYWQ